MRDVELLLPIGRKLPLSIAGTVTQVDGRMAGDIGRVFGRGSRPTKPVYLYRPNGDVIMIAGLGKAEAAEIEDIALAMEDKKPFDFEEARERRGLPSATQFDTLFRDALDRQIKYKKAMQRTDPTKKKYTRRVWQGGTNGMD